MHEESKLHYEMFVFHLTGQRKLFHSNCIRCFRPPTNINGKNYYVIIATNMKTSKNNSRSISSRGNGKMNSQTTVSSILYGIKKGELISNLKPVRLKVIFSLNF